MRKLSNLGTVVVVLGALFVSGAVAHREFFSTPSSPAEEVTWVEDWEALAARGSLLGSHEATVRLVEFSDFQCPFCAEVRLKLEELQQEYAEKVAIVYRHLPLESVHPHALAAALAAECAGAQGRFKAYHDALFERQDSIGVRGWERYAEDANVPDPFAFNRCVAERRFEDRVREDVADARRAGVKGTPTFIVNGRMISGVSATDVLSSWIDAALDHL